MDVIEQKQSFNSNIIVTDTINQCNGNVEPGIKLPKSEENNKTDVTLDESNDVKELEKSTLDEGEIDKIEVDSDHVPNGTSIKYVRAKESDDMVKSAMKEKCKGKNVNFEMDKIDKHYER